MAKKRPVVTEREVRQKYPVDTYVNPETRSEEERALVRMEDLREMLSDRDIRRKQNLIQRIASFVRPMSRHVTDQADDEGTSEVGGATGSSQGGIRSDEYYDQLKIDNTRMARYQDYEYIDAECVELARAREVTVSNVFSSRDGDEESYKLASKVPRVLAALEGVDERTNMQNEIPGICDGMLHYGDDFEEVVVDNRFLITRLKWLNQKHMYRNEDEFGRLKAEEAFTMKREGSHQEIHFKFWQVRHLRHNHKRGCQYGRSFYFNARKPWRYLRTMEDGVLMTRVNRADDHLVFSIPAPRNASPAKLKNLILEAKRNLKRRNVMDSSTGQIDSRSRPLPDGNDFYITVPPEGQGAKVERLSASGVLGELRDVEHFQNKIFMATGVPKSYLGVERDVNAKATLSWQDIEFARMLRKIQREMAAFQRSVYDFQLTMMAIPPVKGLYEVIYPPISFVDEQMKMTVEALKWQIAGQAKTALRMPTRWLLQNIIKIPEDEIEEILVAIRAEPEPAQVAPQLPGGQPFTREHALRDMELANELSNIRDMIMVVQSERLNKPYRDAG